jgi:hypothetical protein
MTGYAYPEHRLGVLNKFRAGDVSGAAQEYPRWLPLLVYEGQFAIALRKEILEEARSPVRLCAHLLRRSTIRHVQNSSGF